MHSELFQWGPLTLRAFGLLMALGFLAAGYAAVRLSRGTHRNADYLSTMVVWLMVSGVLGARLAYIAEHWSAEFAGRPAAWIRIDQGGLMFYGGMAGAALALALFARLRREPFFELSDLILTVLPLGHAFGRLGCFMHGCCHGRLSHGTWAVSFPRYSPAWTLHVRQEGLPETALRSHPVIPTQLIEAGANLLFFLLLAWAYRRFKQRGGIVSSLYLIGYAVIRFSGEFLRGDERQGVGAISIGQAISLAIGAVGLVLLVWRIRQDAVRKG